MVRNTRTSAMCSESQDVMSFFFAPQLISLVQGGGFNHLLHSNPFSGPMQGFRLAWHTAGYAFLDAREQCGRVLLQIPAE